MFKKLKKLFKIESKPNPGIFSESPLKTSFYEELQKNGWCDIIDDKPDFFAPECDCQQITDLSRIN